MAAEEPKMSMVNMGKGLVGSRRWFIALLTMSLIALNQKLGLGLTEFHLSLVSGVATAAILGESYRDGKTAEGGK